MGQIIINGAGLKSVRNCERSTPPPGKEPQVISVRLNVYLAMEMDMPNLSFRRLDACVIFRGSVGYAVQTVRVHDV